MTETSKDDIHVTETSKDDNHMTIISKEERNFDFNAHLTNSVIIRAKLPRTTTI